MNKLHFWGVRGSIPTVLSPSTRIGSNTPCLSLELENTHIILDAGTGLYKCGEYLLNHPKKIVFLMSHYHWDHIQGLPYFYPFYRLNYDIDITSSHPYNINSILEDLFDGIKFPIKLSQLSSAPHVLTKKEYHSFQKQFCCSSIENRHPGISFSYRFEVNKKIIVYCSDNELYPFSSHENNQHVQFCKDSDILILDTHYNHSDHPKRRGWGHGFLHDSLELALRSNVKSLYLFHHDPRKSDNELKRQEKLAKEWVKKKGGHFNIYTATEGFSLSL